MKKILISVFIISVFLSSCVEEIPTSSIEKYDEKLVVNEYFNNNSPFSIQVTVSKDAYKESNDFILNQATTEVTLTEDGVAIPLTYDNFDKIYSSVAIPKPGKVYELSISNNNYTTATSRGILPGNIANKSALYIEDGGTDMLGNQSDLLKLSFKDDGNTKDYYKLNFFYYNETISQFVAFDFELNDILAAVNTIKTRDGGFLFTDESFNGQDKLFTCVPPSGIVATNTGAKYLIQIQRLNDDFWKYNTSLEQYRGGLNGGNSGSNLFGGAVVVYTNIKNGLGIFAGSNIESDTLK